MPCKLSLDSTTWIGETSLLHVKSTSCTFSSSSSTLILHLPFIDGVDVGVTWSTNSLSGTLSPSDPPPHLDVDTYFLSHEFPWYNPHLPGVLSSFLLDSLPCSVHVHLYFCSLLIFIIASYRGFRQVFSQYCFLLNWSLFSFDVFFHLSFFFLHGIINHCLIIVVQCIASQS